METIKATPMHYVETVMTLDDKNLAGLIFEYYMNNSALVRGLGIQQCVEEVKQLKDFIGYRKFNNMVEIGVDYAGSMWLYSNLFCADRFTGIDLKIRPIAKDIALQLHARNCTDTILIEAPSNKVIVNNIDFLHIDGEHSYESIKEDFEIHFPNVIDGGIVVLHDTLLWEGAIKFREELEKQYKVHTFKGHALLSGGFGKNPIGDEQLSTGVSCLIK